MTNGCGEFAEEMTSFAGDDWGSVWLQAKRVVSATWAERHWTELSASRWLGHYGVVDDSRKLGLKEGLYKYQHICGNFSQELYTFFGCENARVIGDIRDGHITGYMRIISQ